MHARTFLEVAAAVAAARLVLTVNTGVIHACSAFDKPVVVLANGPDEIREFRPLSAWQLIIEAMNPLRVPDITLREAVNAMNSRLPLQL